MFRLGFLIYICHLFSNSPPLGSDAYSCPILILYHRWVRNFKFWVPKFILGLEFWVGFGILDLERDEIGSKIYFVKRMYQVGGGAKSPVLLRLKAFPRRIPYKNDTLCLPKRPAPRKRKKDYANKVRAY